jgi:hypothetical protein
MKQESEVREGQSQERWVLQEKLSSRKQNRPIYFWKMSAIGPCSTANTSEAAVFASKQEAMMCPAYVHPLSFYEPVPE